MPSFFQRKQRKPSSTANSLDSSINSSDNVASKSQKTTFRVKIPPNIRPGEQFHVYAGDRLLKIKCPPGATPGRSIAVSVPKEDQKINKKSSKRNLHSPNVNPIPNTDPPAFMVTIPPHVRGGQQFPVTINGVDLMVTSPALASPGMSVRIVPPVTKPPIKQAPVNKGQLFEVQVPQGVKPGESFALMANGIRISVKCPMNAVCGQIVRFHLPFKSHNSANRNGIVKVLNYDVDGWVRTLQVSDMKFQWLRVKKNTTEAKESSIKKKINQLAYITRISHIGELEFRPAQFGLVDSSVISPHTGRTLVSCTDLVSIQSESFGDKVDTFYNLCKRIGNHGKMSPKICIQVRREHLLQDSLEAIMSLDTLELKHVWRFQFLGEEGVDAGGLKREWFQLISEMLLDPDTGLWKCCGGNQMSLQINQSSSVSCDDDLLMYRFLGRVLGKAAFDNQLISGHLAPYLYKHLLGWPITFADLEHLDPIFYKSLTTLIEMDDVEYACLDFTTTEEYLGKVTVVPLVHDGENIDVTAENLLEYLELIIRYRLVNRVENQMKELLRGFTEVLPESLLTIFDFQELELLLCGLPNIDVDDWMENSRYSGVFNNEDEMHEICVWFWEIVREMNEELRAKLLQFVTGTSGVPAKGFGILQGNDGEVRLFQIHGVRSECFPYPVAHTCFNRIDLPIYENKAQLEEKLLFAISMVATGFDRE